MYFESKGYDTERTLHNIHIWVCYSLRSWVLAGQLWAVACPTLWGAVSATALENRDGYIFRERCPLQVVPSVSVHRCVFSSFRYSTRLARFFVICTFLFQIDVSRCHYMVDLDLPIESKLEPRYSQSDDWTVVASAPFLDASRFVFACITRMATPWKHIVTYNSQCSSVLLHFLSVTVCDTLQLHECIKTFDCKIMHWQLL